MCISEPKKIYLSTTTVHKYMNRELVLMSVVRMINPKYKKCKVHKVFPNLLQQDFNADTINAKWCTDFTYLYLADGRKRCNCTVIDLHDRNVVASLNGKEITSDFSYFWYNHVRPHSYNDYRTPF